jgi:hypothetical protein
MIEFAEGMMASPMLVPGWQVCRCDARETTSLQHGRPCSTAKITVSTALLHYRHDRNFVIWELNLSPRPPISGKVLVDFCSLLAEIHINQEH